MSIKPYYEDESCKIFHGDCREILPTLEPVDLVLTDPPYATATGNEYAAASGIGITLISLWSYLEND